MSIYRHLFYADFTNQLLSEPQMVDFMIQAELALATAQEEAGLIPAGISTQLKELFSHIEIDLEALRTGVALTGNAAAPLIKQLVSRCTEENPQAAKCIHLGATSQDIVDTVTVMKIKAYDHWLFQKLEELIQLLADLSVKHQNTLMMGRTLMQQARPITFGLKAAAWLQDIEFSKKQLESGKEHRWRIQLGGAVGSHNSYLNSHVRKAFARHLRLVDGPPWHTQRGRIASYAAYLGVLMGSLGKMAQDILLMAQTELGEVREPAAQGRGTSSTMPHKRNPILSTAIMANAHRTPFLVANMLAAIPQTHERSVGRWHAEWEVLDQLMGLTAGSLEKSLELIGGLEVDKAQMWKNIDVTQGLIYAEGLALSLAQKHGKEEAHKLIQTACKHALQEKQHLREVIEAMNLGFDSTQLDQLFDPANSIELSTPIIEEINRENEDIQ